MQRKRLPSSNMVLVAIVAMAFSFILTACGPSTPAVDVEEESPVTSTPLPLESPTENEAAGSSEDAYPPPTPAMPAEESYPAGEPPTRAVPSPTPLPEGYPASSEEVFEEPRFQIDQPLVAGAERVTGQAPPNMRLAIANVTLSGEVLGTGVSDDQGRFDIAVSPLPAGNRIGVTFGELEEGMSFVDMAEEYYPHRGDNFMNIPNVGLYLETGQVEQ